MAQAPSSSDPRRRAHWIGIATAIMCALAGGAIWCLLALYARRDLIALSLPIAAVIVWALRVHGYARRWLGALIAVFSVALACAYSLYLQSAAQIASLLGLPFRAAIARMDAGLAFDIAWANIDAAGLSIFACAMILAAAGTLWNLDRPNG